jgi:type I restriction enzyme S subunit
LIAPGSVLFSSRASIGKIAIVNKPCATNQGFANFTPHDGIVDKWFLANLLCRYTAEIRDLAGKTTFLEVPRSKLKAFKVAIPHIDEQRRIVARIKECMERVGEIDGLTEEQSRAEGQVLRAARREFLGGIFEIPPGWKEKRLDELADVIYGISAAISKNKDSKIGPPIVRMANISLDGHLDLSDLRYCPIPKGKQGHFALKPGDLLLNWRSGSAKHVGKTALFNEEGLYTCASFILRIRSFEGVSNNRYLRHVLNFMRAEGLFSDQSRMQINHKLNATEFSAFPIRVPPIIEEQEVIADKLDDVETLSNQIRHEISLKLYEVRDLRESILRKAFAGEL